MTTTVKIKRKSNIKERRNRPRKVKMNFSKVNESVKINKTSNNIVNVIKDTSKNIIDKAKANLFGTPEINLPTKNQPEINDKTNHQTHYNKNSTKILDDTILQEKDSNQNETNKPPSTTNKHIAINKKNNNKDDKDTFYPMYSHESKNTTNKPIENKHNDEDEFQNPFQSGQHTPPIKNKFLSDDIIQNRL